MNTSLFAFALPALAGPSLMLPMFALMALVAIGWLVYQHTASKPAPVPATAVPTAAAGTVFSGVFGHLNQLLHLHGHGQMSPRLAAVLRSGVKRIMALDEADDHKLFDELLRLSGHSAAIPAANAIASVVEKHAGVQPSDTSANGQGLILQALEKLREAIQAKQQKAA